MFRPSLLLTLSAFLLCLLTCHSPLVSAQLNPNTELSSFILYDFETPRTSYSYNPPITVSQPWNWTSGQGGIASQGSPFDPPGATTPPHMQQVRDTTSAHSISHCSEQLMPE